MGALHCADIIQQKTGAFYLAEVESRTQGSRSRPRTQTKSEAKPRTALPRTDPSRSRPKTKDTCASVLQKKGLQNFFQAISKTKRSSKIFFRRSPKNLRKFPTRFLTFSNKILTIQKIVLSMAEIRAIFEDLRLKGQQVDLRGQGLQNVSSRTSSKPSTSKCVLEAKDFKRCPRGLHFCQLDGKSLFTKAAFDEFFEAKSLTMILCKICTVANGSCLLCHNNNRDWNGLSNYYVLEYCLM